MDMWKKTNSTRVCASHHASVEMESGSCMQACRIALVSLALIAFAVQGAPRVFEETAKIVAPESGVTFPLAVAVDGDDIIAVAALVEAPYWHYRAYLFRRDASGAWQYVATLMQATCDDGEVGEENCIASAAVRNGLAVVSAGGVFIFERTSAGNWVLQPSTGDADGGGAGVGTGVVLTTESICTNNAPLFSKDASGTWTRIAAFPGIPLGCDSWASGGPEGAMSAGNRFAVASQLSYNVPASVYEPSGMSWVQAATLTLSGGEPAPVVRLVMDDDRVITSGDRVRPLYVFERAQGWAYAQSIVPPDTLQLDASPRIAVDDFVVASFLDPHRGGSARVFERTASGAYEQVARLLRSDSTSVPGLTTSGAVAIDAEGAFARVVVAGHDALYVYDLDALGTTSAPLEETFEQGNAANWTPMAGSSFSVVTSGESKVYRQSSVAGDAGAFVTGIDWTDQAIEADVTPTAFNGAGRWVGLTVRRTDDSNYYYLKLSEANVIEIKRMPNGTFGTLASAALPVALGRTYRLRLEAVGTLLRAYVDGRLIVEAHDDTLAHGHAGVRLYQARADFDNVLVSQNPHLTLVDQRRELPLATRWSTDIGVWSANVTDNQQLVQQDLSGDARAVARVDAQDQIVQARVRATAFAAGQGRWFGLIARYRDAGNYYYLKVSSDNTVSLRKLVDGTIQELDAATLPVSAGTWYTLRLEAVGSSVRAYVNGRVLVEASDTSHPSGRYGAVTYKAAAIFDDLTAWEP
jgi:Uncharacterized protein conserved in bacteria